MTSGALEADPPLTSAPARRGPCPPPARAVRVNVNRGDVSAPSQCRASPAARCRRHRRRIAANLQRSDLFRPLDPASFTEHDLNVAVQTQPPP
jgi:TolB protein